MFVKQNENNNKHLFDIHHTTQNDNIKKNNQHQQQKLQHQHEIVQGIVKPMPDDLQKSINLLGNRK